MSRAYVIAEAGVNHGGNLHTAGLMVKEAATHGCDAIKFQVYDPDKLATKDAPAYWDTTLERTPTQRELFRQHAGLTRKDYEGLSRAARGFGIDFIVSVFHPEDVAWLEPLVSHFKIASADITNTPLLEAVAATGKPVILSTGASEIGEIFEAQRLFTDVTLLHCTLCYPTKIEDVNLSAIFELRGTFPARTIGYSDHSIRHAVDAIVGAWYCGARVFEKHFSLDPSLPGNDHYHSFSPARFRILREALDRAEVLYGGRGKRVLECERPAREGARRSVVASKEIRSGDVITEDMVCLKRPGAGIANIDFVVGRRAVRDIAEDEAITEAAITVEFAAEAYAAFQDRVA